MSPLSRVSRMPAVSAAAALIQVLAVLAAHLVVASPARAADLAPRLTIVEGTVTLTRAAGRGEAPVGIAINSGDILELPAQAGAFARIELADGALIELGPAARVMFRPRLSAGAGRDPALYVLAGWVKLAAGKSGELSLRTPTLSLATRGAVLLDLQAASLSLFTESGEARVSLRRPGNEPSLAFGAGQFMLLPAGEAAQSLPRPPASWLAAVPRALRDRVPPQRGRFENVDAPRVVSRPAGYGEVEAWLKSEPALRVPQMTRWRPRAADAEFRAELVKNMRAHPEWDRVLFPEKYLFEGEPGRAPAR